MGYMEGELTGPSKREGLNRLVRYSESEPEAQDLSGGNLFDSIVEGVIADVVPDVEERGIDWIEPTRATQKLRRELQRDGFVLNEQRGTLQSALPDSVDLPAIDDEVHSLLARHGLATPVGHLDQAIDAHGRGNWAGANSQIRPFIESLFDEIAGILARAESSSGLPEGGHRRRQWLANLPRPFYGVDLNEWTHDGKGFLEAFYKRLHEQGPHPGLSNEEDSTFRLHLALLVARMLLRRLDARVP